MVELIAKWVTIIGAAAYICGFVIVNAWLSGADLYLSFVAQTTYLSAGLLYFVLLVVGGLGWIAVANTMRQHPFPNGWSVGEPGRAAHPQTGTVACYRGTWHQLFEEIFGRLIRLINTLFRGPFGP
jgi:hypothetical protein